MIKKLQSITIKANTEISPSDLGTLAGTQLLESITINNAQLVGSPTFAVFNLQDNHELTTINLVGTEGLSIPTIPAQANAHDTFRPIPKAWSALTKLSSINLQHCGLSSVQLTNLLKDFAERANEGLGSAITGTKSLILTGQNAQLPISDATVAAAKAALVAKGWSVTHN